MQNKEEEEEEEEERQNKQSKQAQEAHYCKKREWEEKMSKHHEKKRIIKWRKKS